MQLIKQLHDIVNKGIVAVDIVNKGNLKIAPEKSLFMHFTVKFLGHEIGPNTIQLIQSKNSAIHKNFFSDYKNRVGDVRWLNEFLFQRY